MTENHDDMKLISAREHAARSLSKPPQVFLYRHGLYAFGEALLTEGVKRATHHPGFAWGPLACPDCNFVRRGPMLDADLRAVVEQTLGERGAQPVPCFGTLADLQAAMAEYPLTVGSAEELAWHVAETNALRQIRPDAPAASRARLLSETRTRAVQNLRGWNNPASDLLPSAVEERRTRPGPTDLLCKAEGKSIDSLSDEEWAEFCASSALADLLRWGPGRARCNTGVRVHPSPRLVAQGDRG